MRYANELDPLFLDFETYYDRTYSLKKMSVFDYVMDDRFEAILLSIKRSGRSPTVIEGPDIARQLARVDWSKVVVGAHNMRFDGMILRHRYGIVPKLYIDTMGMGMAMLRDKTWSMSLSAIAKALGVPAKGTAVQDAIGKRFKDFTPDELETYKQYAGHDAVLAEVIWRLKAKEFPLMEALANDCVLRMSIEPGFRINYVLLDHYRNDLIHKRDALFAAAGDGTGAVFRSLTKFANHLRDRHNIAPPEKYSAKQAKMIPALSKTDPEFQALQHKAESEGDTGLARSLKARVEACSNIHITRAERLANAGANAPGAQIPMPLVYYAAHTGRLGGTDKLNGQNYPKKGEIRDAHEAPEGRRVVVGDASQIEARLVAVLAGQDDLVQAFEEGRDVYKEFASVIYVKPVEDISVDERTVGKVAILSLGYGSGAGTFQGMLKGYNIIMDLEQCQDIVNLYRQRYPKIKKLWWDFDTQLIRLLCDNANQEFPLGIKFVGNKIKLPNGLDLVYPGLHSRNIEGRTEWFYYQDKLPVKLYGAKVVENVTQTLASILIRRAMVIMRGHGFNIVLQVHDEMVYLPLLVDVDRCKRLLDHSLCSRPDWAKAVPLRAEVGDGPNYGAAK